MECNFYEGQKVLYRNDEGELILGTVVLVYKIPVPARVKATFKDEEGEFTISFTAEGKIAENFRLFSID